MEKTIIETKDLSFSYEEKQVLKKINVSIRKGEKIAVMGCNGAGKSTFFLNLNGVLQPDDGTIFFHGEKMGKKNFLKLHEKVGFVFQDADSQMIASNVKAEISFGPMNLGLSRQEVEKRVEDAVAYMELGDFINRAPHYLSGGEKKRVSIADILAMQPEVLIFDEPMAALDPVNAQNVEEVLNRIHEDGKTLIIATHDVEFAYRFSTRILVFCDGDIIADGTTDEIFHREDVLERAHLKQPSIMTIWEALVDQKIVPKEINPPKTAKEAAKKIQEDFYI